MRYKCTQMEKFEVPFLYAWLFTQIQLQIILFLLFWDVLRIINDLLAPLSELQIKKNSCQTLGPASKRVLPDLSTFCQTYFIFRKFLIFHFQYSMIKGTILNPWHNSTNDYYDLNQIKDIAKRGLVIETTFNLNRPATSNNQ